MKDFRLALVAQECLLNAVEKNLASTEAWARKAKAKKADIVCFPELSITGHGGDPAMIRHAQSLPDGPACQRLIKLARELNIYICAGIAEEENRATYNTQFIVGPEGFAGKQRKVHASGDEYFFFRHGSTLPVFDLPFAKVGMVICFDNEIVECARTLAVQGAELILSPHAARYGKLKKTPAEKKAEIKFHKDHFMKVHTARAYDNAAYVGLCNAVGSAAAGIKGVESNHCGLCMAWNPKGDLIGQTKTWDFVEEMIVVDCPAEPMIARREKKGFNLRVRRVEAFGPITKLTF